MVAHYVWRLEQCQMCGGQNVTMKSELLTKHVMRPGEMSQAVNCCDTCAKEIDRHNEPIIKALEEETRKRKTAKKIEPIVDEYEDAPEEQPDLLMMSSFPPAVDQSNGAVGQLTALVAQLAGQVGRMQEQQDKMLKTLMKDKNVKPKPASTTRRKR